MGKEMAIVRKKMPVVEQRASEFCFRLVKIAPGSSKLSAGAVPLENSDLLVSRLGSENLNPSVFPNKLESGARSGYVNSLKKQVRLVGN